jgi:uncharacterized protein (TIGR02147 family)
MLESQTHLFNSLVVDFESRKTKDSGYSLRDHSKFLGIPTSGLSEIFNGKRKISRRMARKLMARIPLEAKVAAEVAKELSGKSSKTPEADNEFVVLDRSVFEVISNWHYFAIISLCDLDDFDSSAKSIANRLGIPLNKAKDAVAKLIDLDLLSRNSDGRLKPTQRNLTTTTDISNLAIRRSHQEHLDLASAALERIAVEERDFGFINIATSPDLLPEAKEKMRRFRRELCRFLESTKKTKTAIYRLGFQFFPITKNATRRGRRS